MDSLHLRKRTGTGDAVNEKKMEHLCLQNSIRVAVKTIPKPIHFSLSDDFYFVQEILIRTSDSNSV